MPGLFRLGDQKAVIHSFTGDGMAMALHSAFMAAGFFLAEGGSAQYNVAMQNALRQPVRNAQILAKAATNPSLNKIMIPMAGAFPGLLQKIYYATRC